MNILQAPANPGNYDKGRAGHAVVKVVIHVMDGVMSGTAAWFANDRSNVSAHYGIGSDGTVVQYVQEADTAWQAGVLVINEESIGVEHEGRPADGPWTPTRLQLQASATLVADICKRYGITPSAQTIVPHSSINPQHNCPGPTWPWAAYLGLVTSQLTPQPAHTPGAGKTTITLYDPATNKPVGTASLIDGTRKAYIVPSKP